MSIYRAAAVFIYRRPASHDTAYARTWARQIMHRESGVEDARRKVYEPPAGLLAIEIMQEPSIDMKREFMEAANRTRFDKYAYLTAKRLIVIKYFVDVPMQAKRLSIPCASAKPSIISRRWSGLQQYRGYYCWRQESNIIEIVESRVDGWLASWLSEARRAQYMLPLRRLREIRPMLYHFWACQSPYFRCSFVKAIAARRWRIISTLCTAGVERQVISCRQRSGAVGMHHYTPMITMSFFRVASQCRRWQWYL